MSIVIIQLCYNEYSAWLLKCVHDEQQISTKLKYIDINAFRFCYYLTVYYQVYGIVDHCTAGIS